MGAQTDAVQASRKQLPIDGIDGGVTNLNQELSFARFRNGNVVREFQIGNSVGGIDVLSVGGRYPRFYGVGG